MSLAVGLLGMIYAVDGSYQMSAYCVFVCMGLDGLDGCLARWFQAISAYGQQLDSLVDVVVFGVAPALLVYFAVLQHIGVLGMLLCFGYVMAGAVRLARYNLRGAATNYQGQPITAAAAHMAMLVLVVPDGLVALSIAVPTLALLMVCSIPYPRRIHLCADSRLNGFALMIVTISIILLAISPFRAILLVYMVVYNALAMFPGRRGTPSTASQV